MNLFRYPKVLQLSDDQKKDQRLWKASTVLQIEN